MRHRVFWLQLEIRILCLESTKLRNFSCSYGNVPDIAFPVLLVLLVDSFPANLVGISVSFRCIVGKTTKACIIYVEIKKNYGIGNRKIKLLILIRSFALLLKCYCFKLTDI